MSVTLTQVNEGGHPDRPAGGGAAMQIDCAMGIAGASLSVNLTPPMSTFHIRVAVHVDTLVGGELAILIGFDASDDEVVRLSIDADEMFAVVHAGAGEMAGVLSPSLPWHCIEIGFDEAVDEMRLWIDGVPVSQVSAMCEPLASLAMGGMFKPSAMTGRAMLDELVVDNSYIGPVIVEPGGPYADDPTRWLVIYSRQSDDSVNWVEHYRQARGVPLANLLGLVLPDDETITQSQLDVIRLAIKDYLDRHALGSEVIGILFGYGVPGYYLRDDGAVEPVASRLHTLDAADHAIGNTVSATTLPARPTSDSLGDMRLTSRIDGPDLAAAIALVDRAGALMALEDIDGDDMTLWFDAVNGMPAFELIEQQMLEWVESVERQMLRLPLCMTEPTGPPSEVSFSEIHDDGFFIGWSAASMPEGFLGEPAGRRIFAMQLNPAEATGPTLRDSEAGGWAGGLLRAGYASVAGSSRVISASNLPCWSTFFESLRQGWTLAEAWFTALPVLGDGLHLVGDPLFKPPLPRAGWNVYGPFSQWSQANGGQPIAALRRNQTDWAIPAEHRPGSGVEGIYLVRRVDLQGVEETGLTHLRVMNSAGDALSVPASPCWPRGAGWRAEAVEDGLRMRCQWADHISAAGVGQVHLIEEVSGLLPQIVETLQPHHLARDITVVHVPGSWPVRYRFRAVHHEGGWCDSPWSAWHDEPTANSITPVLVAIDDRSAGRTLR
jgi:uncharacterized protein (TIGR03790 family)